MIGSVHGIGIAFVDNLAFAVVVTEEHSKTVFGIQAISAAFKEFCPSHGIDLTENIFAGAFRNLNPEFVLRLRFAQKGNYFASVHQASPQSV